MIIQLTIFAVLLGSFNLIAAMLIPPYRYALPNILYKQNHPTLLRYKVKTIVTLYLINLFLNFNRDCPEVASVCDKDSRNIEVRNECPVGWEATSAGQCARLITCDEGSRAGFRSLPPHPSQSRPPIDGGSVSQQTKASGSIPAGGTTLYKTCSWESAEATCATEGAHLFYLEPDPLPAATGGQPKRSKRDADSPPTQAPTRTPLPLVPDPLRAADRATISPQPTSPQVPESAGQAADKMEEGRWFERFINSTVIERRLALRPVFIGLRVQFCAASRVCCAMHIL